MKTILLIGLGRFGSHIAKEINQLGHEVLAIDKNEEKVNKVLPFVTSAQIGDATDEELIKSLGVNNFDACIVAIGDDFESSLETTYLLKENGAKKIIARASQDTQAKFLLNNGADSIVYPEKQLAKWTAISCCANHLIDYIELDDDYSLYEVEVPESWIGKTIGELNIRKKYQINIIAVKEKGIKNYDISPDTLFTYGASLLVLGNDISMRKCFHI